MLRCSVLLSLFWLHSSSFGAKVAVSGKVTDPDGRPMVGAQILLRDNAGFIVSKTVSDGNGLFRLAAEPGRYQILADAPGFQEIGQLLLLERGGTQVSLIVNTLSTRYESITVTADVQDGGILSPDPSQRVYVRQETLDANPGRPGAPISIPGLPIESASGGIKAPQYFAPGVAGDHGESISQHIQIGTFLLNNNLSANAHGNGYADPNIMITQSLDGVQTDGGAFNVREGNHSQNVAAIYQLKPKLEPFLTLTGDYRDADITAGWSPNTPRTLSWLAVEAAYGNGFLNRLEHRQQYKFNGYHVVDVGQHQLTLFGLGYFGQSYLPGLVPLNVSGLHDTIDNRQRDQTHSGILALDDRWQINPSNELQLGGMFRTYNLSLLSNFGDGLIRQSEFRTVTAGSSTYISHPRPWLTWMAGTQYQRDAPRHLNLDRDTAATGTTAFQQISSNDVTIGDTAPFVSLDGSLLRLFHVNLGWRREEIQIDNVDRLNPQSSTHQLVGFNAPKATFAFHPADHRFLPQVAVSWGETYFTNDPRIGLGDLPGSPVSRAHSYQLVASEQLAGIDFRLTLGHVTTEATLAKIDADTGLQEYQGPGRNKFATISARRYWTYGMLQGSFSKADARDLDERTPTLEAPRTILDVLGTWNRLPLGIRARWEFEYVGAKPLGDGFRGVPVKELRGSLVRSFQHERMDIGVNFLIASGYTGQTTEIILTDAGIANEQIVGVRLPSFVSVAYTYRFGHHR